MTVSRYFCLISSFISRLVLALQWYGIVLEGLSDKEKEFIGQNNGFLNSSAQSSGLLGSLSKYQQYCNKTGTEVPYFVQMGNSNLTANQKIVENFQNVSFRPFVNSIKINGLLKDGLNLEGIPDGVYTFTEASPEKVNAKIQINDFAAYSTHRTNGASKITFKLPSWLPNISNLTSTGLHEESQFLSFEGEFQGKKENGSAKVYSNLIVAEGFLGMVDALTKGFLQSVAQKSIGFGIMYMPQNISIRSYISNIVSITSEQLFPFSLALVVLLPRPHLLFWI